MAGEGKLTKAEKRALGWMQYYPAGIPLARCAQSMPLLEHRGLVRKGISLHGRVWELTPAGRSALARSEGGQDA